MDHRGRSGRAPRTGSEDQAASAAKRKAGAGSRKISGLTAQRTTRRLFAETNCVLVQLVAPQHLRGARRET